MTTLPNLPPVSLLEADETPQVEIPKRFSVDITGKKSPVRIPERFSVDLTGLEKASATDRFFRDAFNSFLESGLFVSRIVVPIVRAVGPPGLGEAAASKIEESIETVTRDIRVSEAKGETGGFAGGFGSLVGVLADPTLLIPAFGAIRAVTKVGRISEKAILKFLVKKGADKAITRRLLKVGAKAVVSKPGKRVISGAAGFGTFGAIERGRAGFAREGTMEAAVEGTIVGLASGVTIGAILGGLATPALAALNKFYLGPRRIRLTQAELVKNSRVELGVEAKFTESSLRDAFRRRAKVTHPDVGGSDVAFARTTAAYDALRKNLRGEPIIPPGTRVRPAQKAATAAAAPRGPRPEDVPRATGELPRAPERPAEAPAQERVPGQAISAEAVVAPAREPTLSAFSDRVLRQLSEKGPTPEQRSAGITRELIEREIAKRVAPTGRGELIPRPPITKSKEIPSGIAPARKIEAEARPEVAKAKAPERPREEARVLPQEEVVLVDKRGRPLKGAALRAREAKLRREEAAPLKETPAAGEGPPPPQKGLNTTVRRGLIILPQSNIPAGLLELADKVVQVEAMSLIDLAEKTGGTHGGSLAKRARRVVKLTKTIIGKLSEQRVKGIKGISKHLPSAWGLQDVEWVPKRSYGVSRNWLAIEERIPMSGLTPGERKIVGIERGIISATGDVLESIGLLQRDRISDVLGLFQKAPGGKAAIRIPTYEFFDILRRGPEDRLFKVLTDAIDEGNGLGIGPPSVRRPRSKDVFLAIRADLAGMGNQRPSFRRIGPEFTREWSFMPTHLRDGGGTVTLFVVQPSAFVNQVVQVVAARAAFTQVFGQGAKRIEALKKGFVGAGGDPLLYDALVRTLNGMPAFRRPGSVVPLSPTNQIYRMGRVIGGLTNTLASLSLSAAVIPNLPEPFGNVGVFAGFRRMFRSLKNAVAFTPARRQAVRELERKGAITLDVLDWTIDRDRWLSSTLNLTSGVIGRASGLKFVNEWQEQFGGIAALTMLKDFAVGRGTIDDVVTLKLLKFPRKQAERIVSGKGSEAENIEFLQKFARFNTGSTALKAETSALRNTRTYRFFVRFTGYFSNNIRQFRLLLSEWDSSMKAFQGAKGAEREKAGRFAWAVNVKMAKYLFGKALSGVMANFLWALALGQGPGVRQKWEEARRRPIKFAFDSFIYSVFGGIYGGLINMGKAAFLTPTDVMDAAVRVLYPVSMGRDAWLMFTGSGPYKNRPIGENLARYLKLHTPALRTMPARWIGMLMGYQYTDPQMQVSIRAYWKWRFNVFNKSAPPLFRSRQEAEESTKKFRGAMRKAYEAALKGQDPFPLINEALAAGGKTLVSVRASLRARRLLTPQQLGKARFTQKLEKMELDIGTRDMQTLRDHDTMLNHLIAALTPVK